MKFRNAIAVALTSLGLIGGRVDANDESPKARIWKEDANETVFFSRQLEFVKVKAVEAEYPELKLLQFAPLEAGVDEGAEQFTWTFFDKLGQARLGTNFATDIPDIGLFGSQNKTNIETITIGYSYTTQDVRRAAKVNFALVPKKAIAAREAIERKAEHVGAHGDTLRNIPGLLTNTSIPIVTSGITGTWTGATPAQILADLMTLSFVTWKGSKQVFTANAMLLSTDAYAIVAGTPYTIAGASLSTETILSAFLRMQDRIKEVDPWVECDLSAANGTDDRALVYMKRPETLGVIWPLRFSSQPPQARGLLFSVPCESRFGGVAVYQPLACAYCDVLT